MRLTYVRILILSAFGLLSCKPGEEALARDLDDSNYCQAPDDCVNLGNICPFGCNLLVNVDEVDRLRRKLTSFLSDGRDTCPLECDLAANATCEDFRCVPSFAQ